MAARLRHQQSPGVDVGAALGAGMTAGAVFMMLQMLLFPAFGSGTTWTPLRMIAAILVGQDVLAPLTFDLGVVLMAMLVHFPLSIAYALVVSGLTARARVGRATLIGAAFGIAIYLVNFHIFTAVYPWFAMARGGVNIFVHALFGAFAAASYKALSERAPRAPPLRDRATRA